MRRNEVDAGAGAASVATVEIAGPRQAPREVANQPAVTFPVRTHGVAVLVVPFGPADGKIADLVAALTEVPRFRNQLDLR